ncbi:MAG: hypothetical protein WC444_04500 [Candidatus Paceibacterota bacterium]
MKDLLLCRYRIDHGCGSSYVVDVPLEEDDVKFTDDITCATLYERNDIPLSMCDGILGPAKDTFVTCRVVRENVKLTVENEEEIIV